MSATAKNYRLRPRRHFNDPEPTEFQKQHHSELQMEIDRAVRARVLDGIELLKREHGEDWVDHIDLNVLDLRSGTSCVLGQLYGTWERGKEDLNIKYNDGLYGFSFAGVVGLAGEGSWDTLQAAWLQELFVIKGWTPE